MDLLVWCLYGHLPCSKGCPGTGENFVVLPHGRSHHADSGQNLLGKSDEQTTEYAEDALGRTEEAVQAALDEVKQSRVRFRTGWLAQRI